MADSFHNLTDDFVKYFNELKKYSGGDPTRLKDQSVYTLPHIKLIIENICRLENLFSEREREFPGKPWPQVHPDFPKIKKEYVKKWKRRVSSAHLNLVLVLTEEDLGISPKNKTAETKKDAKEEQKPEDIESSLDDDFCVYEMEFDLMFHDPAESLETFFSYIEKRFYDRKDSGDYTIARILGHGLEALDYFKDQGLNFKEINERLKYLETIYVPTHISNQHVVTSKEGLYGLLNEARTAFIFGSTLSALVMCRAVLELILKKHYVPDWEKKELWKLWELIESAEDKDHWIRKLGLRAKKNAVNKIIHSAAIQKEIKEKEGLTFLNFMKVLKELIEKAPE